MKRLIGTFALALAALAIPAASAQDADFHLLNNSSWEIHAFNTMEHGAWSENWLDSRINPGETFNMTWAEEGNCSVHARVTYAGGDYTEAPIDFCEASRIVVTDDGMYWE